MSDNGKSARANLSESRPQPGVIEWATALRDVMGATIG